MMRKIALVGAALAGLAATAVAALPPAQTRAASHREAPLIALDPTADITDFFMFRSYEAGKDEKLVLLMDVIPGEEPSSGPNYWNFDPNVRYSFHLDTNQDGRADDIELEFRFENELRGTNDQLDLPLSYVALPPITSLGGAGSEGIGLRQKYDVVMTERGKSTRIADDLIAVPSNVGPRTMPDYASLARQGVYELPTSGVRVFAGQRQDPFYIDLGGVFDTLNLRRSPLPLLSAAEDADDTANAFGVNTLGGVNVHTIAIEVPIRMITRDGRGASDTQFGQIGAYASTSRRAATVLGEEGRTRRSGGWVQVQRLANPLVNEVIIPTKLKDRWNALDPRRESLFEQYYLNPRLALALETVFKVPAAKNNRTDLRDLLLKYKPDDKQLSDLLRLNLKVAPTPPDQQQRMGPLASDASGAATPDPAAWPNGRRPIDDVTDIAVRVVGGTNYIQARAGDGINVDDAELLDTFPFLATPFDGRNRGFDE